MRVAGIDVGSNGIRLLVADAVPGGFEVVHKERAAVRLGHHAFIQGHLDRQVVQQAIDTLAGFRLKLQELGVHRARAVATSAVRESEDWRDFAKAVKKKAGLRVEVIDGKEETRLVHGAVQPRVPWNGKPWLIMDLGGGSLELALVDRQRIHWSESRRIGTVRLLEKHANKADGPLLAERIHKEVDEFQMLHAVEPLDIGGLAATGGNINELAALAAQDPRDEPTSISYEELDALREALEGLTPEDRMVVHDLRPDRADVIVPAAMVYQRVAFLVGAQRIHVPGWGLREGIVLDLLQQDAQEHGGDPVLPGLEQGALAIGRAFRFDEGHALHTAYLAMCLFDQLGPRLGLGTRDMPILRAAALLHDVGRAISAKGHHKHSQYLIENADVAGLDSDDAAMAGTVARYHRKAWPQDHHHRYRLYSGKDRKRVDGMAALLRLADGLDGQHVQNVRHVTVDPAGDGYMIRLAGRDTHRDLAWAEQKADLLRHVLRTPVTFEVEGR